MDKRSFIFYATWLNILEGMTKDEQLEYLLAVCHYGIHKKMPPKMSDTIRIALMFVSRDIDAAKERKEEISKLRAEAGRKGGAPKGNTNASKTSKTSKNKQTEAKTSKTSLNDNVNDNVNDNDLLIIPPLSPLTGGKGSKKGTLITQARKVFERKYEELTGNSYYWVAKDAAGMRDLLKKISHSREQREMPIEDADLLASLDMFLNSITDNWLLSNFSVSIISSKYNEIIAQAQQKYGNNQQARKQRIVEATEIIARLAAEEAADSQKVRRG